MSQRELGDCGVLEPVSVSCLGLDRSLDAGALSMSLKADRLASLMTEKEVGSEQH